MNRIVKYSGVIVGNDRLYYILAEEQKISIHFLMLEVMYWTLELASKLEGVPRPTTRDELTDHTMYSGAPPEVMENLQEMEDEGEVYESIEDTWPDYPSKEDFFFNEEEY